MTDAQQWKKQNMAVYLAREAAKQADHHPVPEPTPNKTIQG